MLVKGATCLDLAMLKTMHDCAYNSRLWIIVSHICKGYDTVDEALMLLEQPQLGRRPRSYDKHNELLALDMGSYGITERSH